MKRVFGDRSGTIKTNQVEEVIPHISPNRRLPEITLKATLLSVVLAIVMAGSNAYLGLKLGITVTATIPAAVISMAILKFFKHSNILENNIVQTATSAGEVIAAAVAFTLPALIMMQYWTSFPFFLTTAIVVVGGLLGVLFSIPLRRAFIIENPLKFPEGIATGEVLKAGEASSKEGARDLVLGGALAAVSKFAQSGLMILEESAHYWTTTARTVFGFGTGLSLVMIAAGYIVGIEVGVSMLLGNIGVWCMGVPLYGYLFGVPEAGSSYESAIMIWNSKLRMIGVGAMIVGGIWTIIHLIEPIKKGVASSIAMLKHLKLNESHKIKRTDFDIPVTYVIAGVCVLMVPLFFIFHYILSESNLALSPTLYWITVATVTLFTLIVGFIGAGIAGYMTGIVGSSNNPLSGVTIMAVLSISFILFFLLSTQIDFHVETGKALAAAGMTIIIGAVMANAAAISGDNLQDLKAGQIVGATPWKQQVMLMLGVIVGAVSITPILQVLYEAYGIGNSFPREGMDPAQALAAPKAAIMAAIAQGVFEQSLDWTMIFIGFGIAVVVIALDTYLKKRNSKWSFPVLAVALGIYMPQDIIVPLTFGGLVAYFADRRLNKQRADLNVNFEEAESYARRRGVLFCSGLIAGEALVGIMLAAPFAAYQTTTLFKIAPDGFESMAVFLGTLVFIGTSYYLYYIGSNVVGKKRKKA